MDKTYHKTIRKAIEYYLPEIAERMRNAKSIEDAEKRGMITEAEGNKIALWLYKNNGEVKNIHKKEQEIPPQKKDLTRI